MLVDFWSENGGMLAPKSMKNRCKLRKAIFWKIVLSLKRGLIFEVLGVEVGSKNPSKNDQKMKSTWEGILASMFIGFWWILGRKLGGKIEPRGIKNGIGKTMKIRRATRWPKNRNKMPQPPVEPGVLVPGEGVGGGVNPSQRVETRRVERRGVESRHPTLDHPSPEGWWDYQ